MKRVWFVFCFFLCAFLSRHSLFAASAPPIEIAISEGQKVKLSWPDGTNQFVLEGTSELSVTTTWNALNAATLVENGRRTVTIQATGTAQYFRLRGEGGPALTTIIETSPNSGESGVSVNRETILRFSGPLSQGATVDTSTFYAEFGGRKLLSRVELSSDRKTVSLFYQEPLPAGGRIQVRFVGDNIADELGTAIDADGDGAAGGTALIEFDTMSTSVVPATAVSGHVYASEPMQAGNGLTNRPLRDVLITVDGAEEKLRTATDANGFFMLNPCPAGRFFVHIDGRHAAGSDWPSNAYYPFVGKTFEAAIGKTNNLAGGSGEIFLPLIKAGTLQPISVTEPTKITFPPDVLAQNPALNGVSVTVLANSLFSDDGLRGGLVGIAPVAPDRIPSPLPTGLLFPVVITIQTDGPSNFDTPAPVQFPNLPDPLTGEKLGPREKTWLWSFNHDTGRWEPQGTMTISADGLFAVSDPGVGVRQPGWHGVNPGSPTVYPPSSQIIRHRKPCVPLTLEQVQKNAQADLDCYGKSIPFFEAIKTLVQAGSAINDLVLALETISSGGVEETLIAACKSFFLAKDLVGKAAKGLSAAASDTSLSDILACLVPSLQNVLLNSCTISSCLSPGTPPTICQELVEKIQKAEELYGDAKAFSADPKGFTQEKLETGVNDACNKATPGSGSLALSNARVAGAPGVQPALDEALRLQQVLNQVTPLIGGIDDLLSTEQALVEQVYSPIWAQLVGYRNAYYRLSYGDVEFRGRSSSLGNFDLPLLQPNVDYTFEIYEPLLNMVAVATGKSAAGGKTTIIPDPILQLPGLMDLSGDTDEDGLTDLAERVIGTRADQKDSDGDGVSDLAEVQQGMDPLGGLNLPAGIIASASLPGEAYGLRYKAGKAYIATGSHGLAIADVGRIDAPVLLGQIDLGGLNVTLAVSETNKVVAVAALPEMVIGPDSVLHLVDVSDPLQPRLIRSMNMPIEDVEESDGFFFVALKKEVRIIDPVTGLEFGWTPVGDEVLGTAASAGRLYVATIKGLEIYEVAFPTPRPLGKLDTDISLVNPTFKSGDMVIDGDILHGGGGGGYMTADISDPTQPKLLGTSALNSPAIIQSLALNGSGRMVSLISFSASNRDVAVYDASHPTNVDNFLVSFNTRGISRDLDLAGGVALLADFTAGLTLVNTATFDANSQPPQVSVDLNYLDEDPTRDGIQVRAGKTVPIRAKVLDDVQMREARLLFNGIEAGNVKEGPVLFMLDLPGSGDTNLNVTVQVEATDTGGNVGTSTAVTLELVRDIDPPTLIASVPRQGGAAFTDGGFAFLFDEPIVLGTGSVALRFAGTDGIVGNADDTDATIATVRATGPILRIAPTNVLAAGSYRLTIPATLISDRSGNRLSQDLSFDFTAASGSPGAALWISKNNGQYDDPSNWLYGRVPAGEKVLLPEGFGQPVVTIDTQDNILLSLESHLPMRLENGAELAVEREWISAESLVISNASAFVDFSATFKRPVQVDRGELKLFGSATFEDLVTLGRGGALSLDGPTTKADLKAGIAATNFSINVANGATIELPLFVNYDGPGDFTVFIAAGTRFDARGSGSRITLPELLSANGPIDWNVRSVVALRFTASDGAVIELPKLATLTGRTVLTATDAGSRINATNLTAITGPVSDFISSMSLSGGGEITLASHSVLTRCNVTLNPLSVLRGESIALADGSTLQGTGTIEGNLSNQASIILDTIPDALVVDGNLELTGSSIITATIGLGTGNTDAGRIDVSGTATLGGILRLKLARNYTPAAGQEFTLALLSSSPSGSFTQIDDSVLGAALKADLLVSDQGLKIRLDARP